MATKPVMSKAELELFKSSLKNVRYYLEFGTGGSTTLVAQMKTINMTCVDTDKGWLDKVAEDPAVNALKKENKIRLLHVNIGPLKAWGLPADEAYIKKWPDYYLNIWRSTASIYDFIFIDGRFRVACALSSAVFAKDGATVAIHDYPDRPFYYKTVERYYDTIASADSLYILKKRNNINIKTLYWDIVESLFDPS